MAYIAPAALPDSLISVVIAPIIKGETIPIIKTGGNNMNPEQRITEGIKLCMPIAHKTIFDVKGINTVKSAANNKTLNKVNALLFLKDSIPPTK